jgi:glutathione synthase/RimK-type ligase-like ATP-grasp enzyme
VANTVLVTARQKNYRVGLVRPVDDGYFEGYVFNRDYWPKYERFLQNNGIYYSYYNIHASSWQEDAEKYDVIIWQTSSSPDVQEEAESKIYFLEHYLRKKCFPSFKELWSYENKVRSSYLYKYYDLPAIPTFVSHSKSDALKFLNKTSFPIVSKIATGSSSYGVIKLNNLKEATKYVNSCFSGNGRKTYWPYLRQKDYVLFQEFIENSAYDLRIISVGNKVFGYYRYPKAGDFRASGTGIIEKKSLPEEAMRLAVKTRSLLGAIVLAVDLLYSEKEQKHYISETSILFAILTAEQLVIEGKPGYYELHNDQFTFHEGKYWIQELALQEYFHNQLE